MTKYKALKFCQKQNMTLISLETEEELNCLNGTYKGKYTKLVENVAIFLLKSAKQ